MHLAPLAILAAAALGWVDITVTPSRGVAASWQATVGALDRPSERTADTLRRYDLEREYRRDPNRVIETLERAARTTPQAELAYVLAELSWIEGKRADGRRFASRRGASALDRFVDTAAYAWDFLFDPELANGRHPSDPRYRLACDLYNGALDHLIRSATAKEKIQPGEQFEVKIHGQTQKFNVTLQHGPWSSADVHELMIASDYQITGLDTRNRTPGLGVPLIGVRRSEKDAKGADRFFLPETAFPLTAVLWPNSRLRETAAEAERECTLDLVDPIQYRSILAERVPLEADLTLPLAYMWSRTDLGRYRWTGLLRPGDAAERAGLMLLRPYEPDKIPVVMVHGLVSSPLAWIPMLNELLREPDLQSRCQFLLYVYPTGVPLPIAASMLRDALLDAQRTFDVQGQTEDREFGHMVLLGHSMGGLLSHAMVVDSDNRFWELNTDRRFDQVFGPPEVLEELRHYTFFEHLPFVERVVFLATPHRGSDLARRAIGRISSSLISEPDHYSKLLATLVKDNPDAFNRQFRTLPTSIDTLYPYNEVLTALLKMKPGPGVKFHSIIGSLRPGGVKHTTDGVVPYTSSHFDEAESELIVRSGHGVQQDSAAILEVKRILRLHLAELAQRQASRPAAPAPAALR